MGGEFSRSKILRGLDDRAEQLAAQQLDLIAQIEAHLRTARHLMRRVKPLRPDRHRVRSQLTDGARRAALSDLENEIGEIQNQLELQEDTCRRIHSIIRWMQEGAADLQLIRLIAERLGIHAHDACTAHL